MLVAAASPRDPETPRESLRGAVARTRERVDGAPLCQGNLRNEVRGRAESVDAKRSGLRGHRIGAIPDKAGAQERSGVQVVVAVRQWKDETRVGGREFRVTAVDLVAGEARLGAEVFTPRYAECAMSARRAEPGHANAAADCRRGHAGILG